MARRLSIFDRLIGFQPPDAVTGFGLGLGSRSLDDLGSPDAMGLGRPSVRSAPLDEMPEILGLQSLGPRVLDQQVAARDEKKQKKGDFLGRISSTISSIVPILAAQSNQDLVRVMQQQAEYKQRSRELEAEQQERMKERQLRALEASEGREFAEKMAKDERAFVAVGRQRDNEADIAQARARGAADYQKALLEEQEARSDDWNSFVAKVAPLVASGEIKPDKLAEIQEQFLNGTGTETTEMVTLRGAAELYAEKRASDAKAAGGAGKGDEQFKMDTEMLTRWTSLFNAEQSASPAGLKNADGSPMSVWQFMAARGMEPEAVEGLRTRISNSMAGGFAFPPEPAAQRPLSAIVRDRGSVGYEELARQIKDAPEATLAADVRQLLAEGLTPEEAGGFLSRELSGEKRVRALAALAQEVQAQAAQQGMGLFDRMLFGGAGGPGAGAGMGAPQVPTNVPPFAPGEGLGSALDRLLDEAQQRAIREGERQVRGAGIRP